MPFPAQLVANGIMAGAVYALVALSFALIYQVSRFFHFAHGIIFTLGPYFTFLLSARLDLSFWAAIPFATLLCAVLGCLIEILLYRPLRSREGSPLILLLASLGIYIVLQNIISMIFGDDTKAFHIGKVETGIDILGARITATQLSTAVVTVLLFVATLCWLRFTKMGKAMRAVANDKELAIITGIHGPQIILITFALGSALAGIAGILMAFDVDMSPTMGMKALMMGVVAVIIGGVGSISGIAAGALLLGLAQHLGAWKIGSQWQDAIAFAILLIFLLIRPQGFSGKEVKKAVV